MLLSYLQTPVSVPENFGQKFDLIMDIYIYSHL